MHDESIERRLSAALHAEAAVLPFTITSAELERRMALRRRSFVGRRLTLLVAAAVAISLFGIGGALSGLFDQSKPEPTRPIATDATEAPVAAKLATLDQVVAVDPDSVLIAQAHGPADGPSTELDRYQLPPPNVALGTFAAGAEYRVSVACIGPSTLQLEIGFPGNRGPRSGPIYACDGSIHEETFSKQQPQSVGLALSGQASWRAVVHGPNSVGAPTSVTPIPPAEEGLEELVRWDQLPVDPGAQPWSSDGLIAQEIGAMPPREGYDVSARCAAGSPIRVILGGIVDGLIQADTETLLACDPNVVRRAYLGIARPNGGEVFLAAEPDQLVSVLVTSATPPVAITRSQPGWRLSGGIGPDFAFETRPMSFSGAGVGEDHVLVVLACTGTQPIEVLVDDGKQIGAHTQKFKATCSLHGDTNIQTFKVSEGGVGVRYVAPKGTWTALSILVPSN